MSHFGRLRMARMLNGGSGTDGADGAFQPCVERMLFRLMELELEQYKLL